jgi:hypothetical protein
MPMFFSAEPPITGTNLLEIVCRRIPAFNSSGVTGFSWMTASATSSSIFETCSTRSP